MRLSCVCLLAVHALVCVAFSLPPVSGAGSACGPSWTFLFTFLVAFDHLFSHKSSWTFIREGPFIEYMRLST